jgi:hypothetical protein
MRGAITQHDHTNKQQKQDGNETSFLDYGNEKYGCGDAQQERPEQASTQTGKSEQQQIKAKAARSRDEEGARQEELHPPYGKRTPVWAEGTGKS